MESCYGYFEVKEFIGDNKLRAYASTMSPDRDNEIILPDAYVGSKNGFMKNPVLLKFHDYWSESVGKITDLYHDDYGIIIEVEFAPTDEGRKFAKLYKGGFMNAFSIGFIPNKWLRPDEEEGMVILRNYGLTKSDVKRIFTDIELLEVSCVPVPANRDAIVLQAKSFCRNDTEELKEIIKELENIKKSMEVGDMSVKNNKEDKEDKKNTDEEDIEEKNEELDEVKDDIENKEDDNDETALVDQLSEKLADKVKSVVSDIVKENIEYIMNSFLSEIFASFEEQKEFISKELKTIHSTILKSNKSFKEQKDIEKVLSTVLNELQDINKY